METARPSTLRRPEVTFTRVAILVLAALLSFSAVSNLVRSSAGSEPPPAPTLALGSPVVGGSVDEPSTVPSFESGGGLRPTGALQAAVVSSIVDGDTIHVRIRGTQYALRYIGMDAPELDAVDPGVKQMATAARAANASLVEGQEVFLEREVSESDRFGRLLRDVWLVDDSGNYVLVNLELVRLGYAQVARSPTDVRYVGDFTEAESLAKEAGLGLWGLESPPAAPSASLSAAAEAHQEPSSPTPSR
jgi:micrococcal nuclease